jgi:PAS domain S-box-containing protein
VVDISTRKRAEEELRLMNLVLSTQQEASIDGILVVDVNGKMVSSNGRFAEMWGIPSDIMESRSDERALQSVMEKLADPEAFISEVKRLYATPDEKSRDEIALKDGRTFDRYSAPMLDADRKCFGRVWHFRDITESKRAEAALATANSELERRVAERTAELTVANRELESFASSVSHDLRAPLRGIDGWTQAALEDCGPQLDDRGRTYLKRVRSETQRMAELIDGLLELSRVTRAPMKRETVDLTAMVQELEASLRAAQPERAVDFVVAPAMVAMGDAVLLRAVLQNLLGNAWKFTGKRPRARIEVGCTSEPGRTVYHVRDDGAGFDMRYAGKLFAPFQRLHSMEEFPGTGIGLATVQRIIHRHGGKVWAKAEVNQGATFYFTLNA